MRATRLGCAAGPDTNGPDSDRVGNRDTKWIAHNLAVSIRKPIAVSDGAAVCSNR